MTTTAARPATTRLGYVDNLRVLLTVLVLAHHSAVTYGALPLWYWTEPSDSPSGIALLVFVVVNQFYFMGFFFLLSGVFVPGSVDRKGLGAFARDRLIRLGVPLVAFWLLARPLLHLQAWPARSAEGESFLQFWFTEGDVGPLWFVEVLLLMSLAYAAFRALRARSGAPTGGSDAGEPAALDVPTRPIPPVAFRGIAALVALLTVVTFGWRFLVPAGTQWELGGLPSPAYLPQYVILFVVGLLASRRGWLGALTVRQGRVALVVALVSLGPALGSAALVATPGAGALVQLGAALAENMFAVSIIVALLVLFRERFAGQPRWARTAAQNSYAVYVIHPLVLVGVAMVFAPLVAPAGVKFLILLGTSVPLCWGLAHLLRQIPGVSRVL